MVEMISITGIKDLDNIIYDYLKDDVKHEDVMYDIIWIGDMDELLDQNRFRSVRCLNILRTRHKFKLTKFVNRWK